VTEATSSRPDDRDENRPKFFVAKVVWPAAPLAGHPQTESLIATGTEEEMESLAAEYNRNLHTNTAKVEPWDKTKSTIGWTVLTDKPRSPREQDGE
jgi:hypothetical protein